MTPTCACGATRDLRPYGPGGSWICGGCGTRPENLARSVHAALRAIHAAANAGGGSVLLTREGPRPGA